MKPLLLASTLLISLQALAEPVHLERILGYQPSSQGLSFQVPSGGCTEKQDFTVQVVRHENRPSEVTLYRVHGDPCMAFLPTGTQIKFSLEEINVRHGESYIIKNPNGVVQSWIWIDEDSEKSLPR